MMEQMKILLAGGTLSEEDMILVMRQILNGRVSEDRIFDFLNAFGGRDETIEEITGAVRVMREQLDPITAPYGTMDCCGTGGDMSGTYNISTAVALVLAGCEVPVAKHGNRAASSKSGAADILEALGVNLKLSKGAIETALKQFHFAFLMAPYHHTGLKYVASVRKKIGRRTIFNLLGPLANPAGARRQLIGVYDKKLLVPFAQVLKNLGSKKAWIVHGTDGLDEITTTGPTHIAILDDEGHISERTLTPEDFGVPVTTPESLKGGNAEENASALRAILEGQKSAYRNIVCVNSAAGLVMHGKAQTLGEGMELAKNALDNGAARHVLKDYIAFSREMRETS